MAAKCVNAWRRFTPTDYVGVLALYKTARGKTSCLSHRRFLAPGASPLLVAAQAGQIVGKIMINTQTRRAVMAALPVSAAFARPVPVETTDPIIALYQEWLKVRREWAALSKLPGNENWEDPRSLEAHKKEDRLLDQILQTRPTTFEGVSALAAVAWVFAGPGRIDPVEMAEEAKSVECQAIMAIWKSCTGLSGYPVTL